jgi:hypothetical protein
MIRVKRPSDIPKSLTTKGAQATKDDCLLFIKNKKKFLTDFEVDSAIYGAPGVKKKLKKAQHDKCCFCEKNQVEEYGAVEHYRPKKGFKIDKSHKTLTKPGYYWLAYDWENLLFVCGLCNTGYKKNYFALKDEKKRAKSHKQKIANEDPLLIDPCGAKNPRDHIVFNNQFPSPKDDYGRYTVEYCGLDRDSLNVARQKLISDIDARLAILSQRASFSKKEVDKAKQYIIDCRKPEAEFSSMARDYLSQFVFKKSGK